MPSRTNCNRGFTLLEVMIALFLFTVGILALASLMDTSIKSMTLAHGSFLDSTMAARYIECFLARPYTGDSSAGSAHGYEPSALDCASSGMEYGSTIMWEVQHDFPNADTQRIRVTVIRPFRNQMRALSFDYVRAKDFR